MSKRGVPLEEKRQRLLKIFHETCDVFQLRDMEKLGAKQGVISQSVKDVIQSLVDDGLVCMEKIGSSNYYWSFPSDAHRSSQARRDALLRETAEMEEKVAALEREICAERAAREETVGREGPVADP